MNTWGLQAYMRAERAGLQLDHGTPSPSSALTYAYVIYYGMYDRLP